MSVKLDSKSTQRLIARSVKRVAAKARSRVASAINKEMRAGRREITDEIISKTGLKRKIINDRLSITRASPKKLEARLTALFGKRIYMMAYPWAHEVARGGKKVIRLVSQIYRKNMRTGFISKDGSRMYLRHESKKGKGTVRVRAVKGRTVPRLFDELGMKDKYEAEIRQRVRKALKNVPR